MVSKAEDKTAFNLVLKICSLFLPTPSHCVLGEDALTGGRGGSGHTDAHPPMTPGRQSKKCVGDATGGLLHLRIPK
jgi:hypothetical protein